MYDSDSLYGVIYDGLVKCYDSDTKVFDLMLSTADGVKNDIVADFLTLVEHIRKLGSFEYVAVFTDECNGTVHCLFKGIWLPQQWFGNHWSRIHFSYIVGCNQVNDEYYKIHFLRSFEGEVFPLRVLENVAKYFCGQSNILKVLVSDNWDK